MPTTHGSTSPRETHDSRQIEKLRRGSIVTIRMNGAYAALAARQPHPGEKAQGGRVTSSTLRRLPGGIGLLEYQVRIGGATGSGSSTYSGAVVEIEMAQTERPIMCRKDFEGYQDQIERWRDAPQNLREEYKYLDDDGNEQALEGMARVAADLLRRGIESYLVFHPVVTVTRTYDDRPSEYGRNIGRRMVPPVSAPSGYDYLKTADRLQQSQDGETWTRIEQWSGASEADGGWEKSLYKDA